MFALLDVSLAGGFDRNQYNELVSAETVECLKTKHYMDFAIFQVKNETELSPYVFENYKTCMDAGFTRVNYYINPDIGVQPQQQMQAVYDHLMKGGITDNFTIFLNVQDGTQYYKDPVDNQWFITELLMAADEIMGEGRVGILTNSYFWRAITSGWTGASKRPLYWTWIDSSSTLYNWEDFGGWTEDSVVFKQNTISSMICGDYINDDASW